jgi:hypothetical protein
VRADQEQPLNCLVQSQCSQSTSSYVVAKIDGETIPRLPSP